MDIKKVVSKLPTGFAEDAAAMDADQLDAEIISAEETIRETEAEKAADEKLSGARELVRDLSAGYRDVIKAQRAKISYCLYLKEEKAILHPPAKESEKSKVKRLVKKGGK